MGRHYENYLASQITETPEPPIVRTIQKILRPRKRAISNMINPELSEELDRFDFRRKEVNSYFEK